MGTAKRMLLAVLVLLALAQPCLAQNTEGLEAQMEAFRAEYGLDETNFSLCYRDTVTGEEYRFNDTRFLVAASTFKLPLNLYYYELEQSGELSPDTVVGGMPLSQAHYQSLVWSDNDVSIAMLYRLGSFRTYKSLMRKYFTMPDEAIEAVYYYDNYYCTSMMLDALQYLCDRQEQFPEMLSYMKEAQPGEYFKQYVDYEIAHKYGWFEDEGTVTVNDVGIVYTPRPFLLAVYTTGLPNGTEVVGRACALLAAYSTAQYEASLPPEAPAEAPNTPAPVLEPETAPTPEAPEPETVLEPEAAPAPVEPVEDTVQRNLWWMILVAAVIFLAADLGVLLVMRRGGPEDWMEKRAARREKRGKNRKWP
ncbi:MAG: hypothetical protein HFF17_07120 [Oscillospiraceae bacterium]|nr:hypothetical protein [Oscillospiraceae bacterium]